MGGSETRKTIALKNDTIIPPHSGVLSGTNVQLEKLIPYFQLGDDVYLSVRRLSKEHWLHTSVKRNILIKEGIISKETSGNLNVWIFNKGEDEIKITARSPIAELLIKNYEY